MWIIGILSGVFLGFIAQSKRICIGTGIQNIYIQNNSRFLQLLLLFIALQAVGVNLLIANGIITYEQSNYSWLAIIMGSFIFGIGFMIAVQQKGSGLAVEKLLGNGVAFASFIIITLVLTNDIFSPINESLQNFQVRDNDMVSTFGVSRMVLALLLLVAALFWLLKKQRPTLQQIKGNWQSNALFLLVVLVAIIAWVFTGNTNEATDLALTTPIFSFFEFLKTGDFSSVHWTIYIVVGFVVASSLVALKQGDLKRVKWSSKSLFTSIVSGILMAIGVKLAGDCLIGNSLVQTAVFSWHGWLSFGAMMLGIWTVGFFSVIRPTIKVKAKEKIIA